MRPTSLLPALLAFPLLAGHALAGGADWHADFDAAQKVAQQSGKDLLVDFTGSDWCGWCIRLNKEVFDHDEFGAGVKDQFVLVALDFPRNAEAKAKVPNPARNEELRERHGVRGYPTILLMTAKGEVYGRTGYQPGGPAAYLDHLGDLRKGKQELEEIKAAIAAYASASGDAKLAAWDVVAERAEKLGGDSAFVALLVEPLEAGVALDARTQQARRMRAARALLVLGLASDATLSAARELDPKNEHGLLERTLGAQFQEVHDDATARAAIDALVAFEASMKFKDTELQLALYSRTAEWLAVPLEDAAGAKPWAQKALALGPKDERARAALQKIAE